jgi:hypothetical protein
MQPQPNFSFEISLSVLNHLGRNLYRSFGTVLGEAISNAWDAEAKNVWIYIDRENSTLLIKDDGVGMTADDFQQKFLRIGYTKRRDGQTTTSSGRPYIGRKGIGKLALLSCADKIAVISKVQSGQYIGGVIDNSDLDQAITDDLTPGEYPLEGINMQAFNGHTDGHEHGTLIYFDGIKDGIRNTLDNLKKTVALYFRFSLLDNDFNIYINDELVDVNCLSDLAGNTEFLWRINSLDDPYLDKLHSNFTPEKNEDKQLTVDSRVKGFIASVAKPSNLKIIGTGEEVTVDLFVNGRLRERDILKHIPTARVAESYLYGQIHFNDLDDSEDRFTSSRESVVANDPKFEELLKIISEQIMRVILADWDVFRRKHREDGDSEAEGITKKERKSEELYNAVAAEYVSPSDDHSDEARKVDGWVQSLGDDAKFNFASYAECFMSENLVRKLIEDSGIALSDEANRDIAEWKRKEAQNKTNGNVSIDIRKDNNDLSYLDMAGLAYLVDNNTSHQNNLPNDSKEYRPIRDALMHTALLSDEAKRKLTTVFDNIQARVKTLLSGSANQDDS